MKFHSPMIIVADMEKSKRFYTEILGETVQLDLGSYVVMGGFSLMTREKWNELTGEGPVSENSSLKGFELYFEESKLDDFAASLRKHAAVPVFSPLTEAPWGQRTLRFLDPDGHVVEVAEPMEEVVLRLLASGLTVGEAAAKSLMPVEFVEQCQAAGSGAC